MPLQLFASDFSAAGTPFLLAACAGIAVSLAASLLIGVRSQWYYGVLAFGPLAGVFSVLAFVMGLAGYFVLFRLGK